MKTFIFLYTNFSMDNKAKFHVWLIQHIGEDLFTTQIVDAAASIFEEPKKEESFSTRINIDEEDPTYKGDVEEVDVAPLNKGLFNVFDYMLKTWGGDAWFTNFEIARGADVSLVSVGSFVRALRREKWGAHTVEKRRRGTTRSYEYRLVPNKDSFTYRNYLKRTCTH